MITRPCRNCGAPTLTFGAYCRDCEFMTPADAAKRLQVSRATYHRMVRAGKLHQRCVGLRKMLVNRAEIDAILD